MSKTLLVLLLASNLQVAFAQPDTLYFSWRGGEHAEPVAYEPEKDTASYNRLGHFKNYPEQVAVKLHYNRGKPSGLYLAYYPDGSPLIRAVYGWGTLRGDWTEYNAAREITVKGQYRDGERDGKWTFREQGIRGNYKKGLRHGKWKYYDGRELLRIEKYHRGNLINGGTFLFNKSARD